ICDEVIRRPLEEANELHDVLEKLGPGDIVFFDGSHRCLQNSDVTIFFIDFLPSIPDGVTVGIHDIFWPNDYPEEWVDRYYNEQYILGAYILGMGSQFPLRFSCMYMAINYADQLAECLEPELVSKLPGLGGGALWFDKKSL
ncbi:MAG: class I SAM-dependent methyltransferase, partial [Planctomycetota bacterium]